MVKRAVIWCEVNCCNCGGVIGFGYRNAKTISKLKRVTKDWKYFDGEGNLCPECFEKLKNRKRLSVTTRGKGEEIW